MPEFVSVSVAKARLPHNCSYSRIKVVSPMAERIERLTVSLDPETIRRLEERAKANKLHVSSYLRAMLQKVWDTLGGFPL